MRAIRCSMCSSFRVVGGGVEGARFVLVDEEGGVVLFGEGGFFADFNGGA